MSEINLDRFCEEDDPCYGEPFQLKGYIYATDRKAAIRERNSGGSLTTEGIPTHYQFVHDFFEKYDWNDLVPLVKSAPFDAEVLSTCNECNGSGKVEFKNDYHCYHVKCKSCDGKGKVFEKKVAVTIGGLTFDWSYIALIDRPSLRGKIVGNILLCEFDEYQCILIRVVVGERRSQSIYGNFRH